MHSKIHLHRMREWAEHKPEQPALHWNKDGKWQIITWRQYYEAAQEVAKSLIALGHRRGECVAIIARNRPEFLFAQLGTVMAGGIPAPIYMTCTAEQVAYIVDHCRARIAFAENEEQYQKLAEMREKLALEKVILMDSVPERNSEWTIPFDEFRAIAKDQPVEALRQRMEEFREDDIALLIYTSGTTGHPKAVMLTHNNIAAAAEIALGRFSIRTTRIVSYLPLSHIAEQMMTNFAQQQTGGEVYLCPDIKDIKEYLLVAKPTIFLGVPRIWEKLAHALQTQLAQTKGISKRIIDWALRTEWNHFKKNIGNGDSPGGLRRRLAKSLVIDKIKRKLGFDNLDNAFSGAAPLSGEIKKFFASLGIIVSEVYGMSETCGIISSSMPYTINLDSVGKPFEGIEVKLAEDGEIITRGPMMCQGYLHDEQGTRELLQDGWLHTGDIGEFDENGLLRITDRKKALIITAGGKNIAPLPIEKLLLTIPGIGHAVVAGDRKPYLVALLTIDPDEIATVSSLLGIAEGGSIASLATNEAFRQHVQKKIDTQVNSQLARYETIKKFAVLENDFSIDSGELTPTMKIKRKVVLKKYGEIIEGLYT